jgi:hypothetical protein
VDTGVDYTVITVPKYNDSFSRITLDGTLYQIRFSYNMATDCWKFGLFTAWYEPIFQDVKIVPGAPLNHSFCQKPYPRVWFGVKTKLDRVGYRDFWDGNAEFFYMELADNG